MQNTIFIILFLILGLVLGSFLNVVIYRLPRGKSLIAPRSRCNYCKKMISAYDNIPLVSWILLKGRCRKCHRRISVRYPVVESISALLLAGLYVKFGLSVETLIYGILFLFLIPISFIDMDKGLILDKLTIPGFILGVILVFTFHFLNWKIALLGAFSASTLTWLLGVVVKNVLHKESLGFGDVKLLVMTGIYLGFPNILISLFFGAIIATVFVFIGMAMRKITLVDRIPFGPFIALGIVSYIYAGQELVTWYYGLY